MSKRQPMDEYLNEHAIFKMAFPFLNDSVRNAQEQPTYQWAISALNQSYAHEKKLDEKRDRQYQKAYKVIMFKTELLFKTGQRDEAEALLNGEIDRIEGLGQQAHGNLHFMLAEIYANTSRTSDAIEYLKDIQSEDHFRDLKNMRGQSIDQVLSVLNKKIDAELVSEIKAATNDI